MKPVMTLIMAVVVHSICFAQAGPQAGGTVAGGTVAGKDASSSPLTREDSLVLAESLALPDSLARMDSLLYRDIRVSEFPAAIDAVLRDFRFNLRHITGELLLAQGEFENYASLIAVPDAENCIVTKYHSTEDTTASWQARMFSGGEYAEAVRKYHLLYRQLQTCYVRLADGSVFYLEGVWEPARDGAAFTTSTLRLRTGDPQYKEVKVELELVYQLADWAVNINIVSKKRDDEVGGDKAVDQ
jgi:hypothetical protein